MLFIKSFTLMAVMLVFASSCRHGSRTDPSFEIRVYPAATRGFGYAVYQQGKKVIDQPYIPAIQHMVPFRSEEEAMRVARLVNSKLEAHQFPPAMTIHELDSLQIHY